MLRDLIGVPFVDGGRDPRKGCDCFGLAREAMRLFGYKIPDFTVSCFDTPLIDAIYNKQRERCGWQKVDIPQPGDLAAMSIDGKFPGMVQHVGVYIGNGRILQTLKKRGSHLIQADDPYWHGKIIGWYRWDYNNQIEE